MRRSNPFHPRSACLAWIFGALLLSAGCARAPLPADGDSCWWIPPSNSREASPVRAFVTDPIAIDHAPVPTNPGEELVFSLLYDCLTQVDCEERVTPSLATGWDVDPSGAVWSFPLGTSRYPDGSRVHARDVWLSWERARRLYPRWSFWSLVEEVEARDDVVRITLRRDTPDLPQWLADRRLAVAQFRGEGRWPMGTGTHTPRAFEKTGESRIDDRWRLDPRPDREGLGDAALEVHVLPGVDRRDLLSRDADLWWIETKADARYFAERSGEVLLYEFPPHATYALQTPNGWPSPIDREVLATLTVEALAAPSQLGRLGSARSGSELIRASEESGGSVAPQRIWFDEADATAGEIARRLAGALVPPGTVRPISAAALWDEARSSESAHLDGFILRFSQPGNPEPVGEGAVLEGLLDVRRELGVRSGLGGIRRTGSGLDFRAVRAAGVGRAVASPETLRSSR